MWLPSSPFFAPDAVVYVWRRPARGAGLGDEAGGLSWNSLIQVRPTLPYYYSPSSCSPLPCAHPCCCRSTDGRQRPAGCSSGPACCRWQTSSLSCGSPACRPPPPLLPRGKPATRTAAAATPMAARRPTLLPRWADPSLGQRQRAAAAAAVAAGRSGLPCSTGRRATCSRAARGAGGALSRLRASFPTRSMRPKSLSPQQEPQRLGVWEAEAAAARLADSRRLSQRRRRPSSRCSTRRSSTRSWRT